MTFSRFATLRYPRSEPSSAYVSMYVVVVYKSRRSLILFDFQLYILRIQLNPVYSALYSFGVTKMVLE